MNIASSLSQILPQNGKNSCCQNELSYDPLLKQIDLVCRVAIGIFGVYIAPLYFLVSFGIGIAAGCAYAISRKMQQKPMFPDGTSKPVCAQGYMDFLSGMRFPPAVGTLATTSFIAAHMRHDPQFYAPFCGLFLGFWAGREAAIAAHDLAGRVKKPRCCH